MCMVLPSFFQRMTILCRSRSIHRKIGLRDQSLRQVRDQCELSNALQYTAGSDPHLSARSVTPIPISVDALGEDPIPIKGCLLWNRRALR